MRASSSRRTVLAAALAPLAVLGAACAPDPDDSVSVAAPEGSGSGGAPDGGTTGDGAPPGPDLSVPEEVEDLTGQSEVTVTVADNVFEQRYIQVDPGTEITWVNEGLNDHNVTPATEGLFAPSDDGLLPVDASVTYTFDDAGEFPYYCSLHGIATAGQTGFVLVGDG